MSPSTIFSAPFLYVTPLYNFSSDVSELLIDRQIRILRFDDCISIPFDDGIAKHLEVHKPDYLLCQVPVKIPFRDLRPLVIEKKFTEAGKLIFSETQEILLVLRLFRGGRLRAGETFFLYRDTSGNAETWKTAAHGRVSGMTIDYQLLASQATSYSLNSTEIPFLLAFRDKLSPILQNANSCRSIQISLFLYGSDNGEESDVVGAVAALEALLTKREEREGLTYRLSMRIANLLGQNVEERKSIFRDVKRFYNFRSKIVHGDINPHVNDLDSLRETVRRVLLSTMALISEGTQPTDLPDILDGLAFDEEKRRQVQAIASKLLHINVEENQS